MSSMEETKQQMRQLVSTFRLAELQELLSSLNRNKNGQKRQLLDRVLGYINDDCSVALQTKIHHLAGRMRAEQSVRSNWHDNSGLPSFGAPAFGNMLSAPSFGSSSVHVSYSPCNISFVRLPFYDHKDNILSAVKLHNSPNSRSQMNEIRFALNPLQVQNIRSHQQRLPSGEISFNIQVQLRFCLFVSTAAVEQPDNLPPNLSVKVNNENVTLPQPKPCRPTEEPKRPGLPIEITKQCQLRNGGENNTLSISWSTTQQVREYAIVINLVKRNTPEELLDRLRAKGLRPAQSSRDLLMRAFSGDADLAVDKQVVTLACPLSMVRVSIPLRSNNCRHLQCFDALTFLRMNEKKPTWTCPACSQPAPFATLAIDEFIQNILLRAKTNEVVFDPTGQWKDNASETTDLLDDSDDDQVLPQKPIIKPDPTPIVSSTSVPKVPEPVVSVVAAAPANRSQTRLPASSTDMLSEPQNLSTRSQPPKQPAPPMPRPDSNTRSLSQSPHRSTPPSTSQAPQAAQVQQSQATAHSQHHHHHQGHHHHHGKCQRCNPPPIRLPADMPQFIDLTETDDEADVAPASAPPATTSQARSSAPSNPVAATAKQDFVSNAGSSSRSSSNDELRSGGAAGIRRRHLSSSSSDTESEKGASKSASKSRLRKESGTSSSKRRRRLESSSSSSSSSSSTNSELNQVHILEISEEDATRTGSSEPTATPATDPANDSASLPTLNESSSPLIGLLTTVRNHEPPPSSSLPAQSNASGSNQSLNSNSNKVPNSLTDITVGPRVGLPLAPPTTAPISSSRLSTNSNPPSVTSPGLSSTSSTTTASTSRPIITSITSAVPTTTGPNILPNPMLPPPASSMSSGPPIHIPPMQSGVPQRVLHPPTFNPQGQQFNQGMSRNQPLSGQVSAPPNTTTNPNSRLVTAPNMTLDQNQLQQMLAQQQQHYQRATNSDLAAMMAGLQNQMLNQMSNSNNAASYGGRNQVLNQQQQQYQNMSRQAYSNQMQQWPQQNQQQHAQISRQMSAPQQQQQQQQQQGGQPSPPMPPLYPLNPPGIYPQNSSGQPHQNMSRNSMTSKQGSGYDVNLERYPLSAGGMPSSMGQQLPPPAHLPPAPTLYHHQQQQRSTYQQAPQQTQPGSSGGVNQGPTPPPLQLFHPR